MQILRNLKPVDRMIWRKNAIHRFALDWHQSRRWFETPDAHIGGPGSSATSPRKRWFRGLLALYHSQTRRSFKAKPGPKRADGFGLRAMTGLCVWFFALTLWNAPMVHSAEISNLESNDWQAQQSTTDLETSTEDNLFSSRRTRARRPSDRGIAQKSTKSRDVKVQSDSTRSVADRPNELPATTVRSTADPTVINKKLFSIPFYIDPRRTSPREVCLYVSADRGATWNLYQTRPAAGRRFDFHAGADGEFWFVVRSTQPADRPARAAAPEKVVVVDTKPPQLSLTARQVGPGRVVANWLAEDFFLDASSFTLTYQSNRDAEWKTIRTVRPDQNQTQLMAR